MKSNKPIAQAAARFDACASQPLQVPVRTGGRPGPVRQGKLWPGENFAGWTHEWNLAGVLVDQTFILPAFTVGRDPKKI